MLERKGGRKGKTGRDDPQPPEKEIPQAAAGPLGCGANARLTCFLQTPRRNEWRSSQTWSARRPRGSSRPRELSRAQPGRSGRPPRGRAGPRAPGGPAAQGRASTAAHARHCPGQGPPGLGSSAGCDTGCREVAVRGLGGCSGECTAATMAPTARSKAESRAGPRAGRERVLSGEPVLPKPKTEVPQTLARRARGTRPPRLLCACASGVRACVRDARRRTRAGHAPSPAVRLHGVARAQITPPSPAVRVRVRSEELAWSPPES